MGKKQSEEQFNEEQLKEKYMQFQMLQQHMEQIAEHLQMLNQQTAEMEISKNAVAEIGKTPVDTEILTVVANGVFVKGELKDNQKVIINVGSDTTVEKTIQEAVKLLEVQQKHITQKIKDAEEVLEEFNRQALLIYQEIGGEE